MITAAKNAPGEWLVWRLVRGACVKHFNAVHTRQREPLRAADRRVGTIYYVTHGGWWDGYGCMVLARLALRQPTYLMMEERNLRRYRFFTWAGGFGVDRDDGRAALAALDYAAARLRAEPGCALFLFPQGTITPVDRRPLRLYSGLARLARRAGPVRLAPVAMRYEFLREQRPEAFISVGPARLLRPEEPISPRALTAELTAALTAEADQLRDDVRDERFGDFTTVLRGQQGIDRAFDRLLLRRRRPSRQQDPDDYAAGE